MLRLYRSLRRRFVRSGNVKQYLIYSIGEIGLIVVGILIALAISNRNEENQIREQTIEIQKRFYGDLVSDLMKLNRAMHDIENSMRSTKIILQHLENDYPYHDLLVHHFTTDNHRQNITLKPITYYNLKDHGLHHLKSDLIKFYAPDAYELSLTELTDLIREQKEFYNLHVFPMLVDRFEVVNRKNLHYTEAMVPVDYEKLKKDKKYAKILKARYEMRIELSELLTICFSSILAIESSLCKELNFKSSVKKMIDRPLRGPYNGPHDFYTEQFFYKEAWWTE